MQCCSLLSGRLNVHLIVVLVSYQICDKNKQEIGEIYSGIDLFTVEVAVTSAPCIEVENFSTNLNSRFSIVSFFESSLDKTNI